MKAKQMEAELEVKEALSDLIVIVIGNNHYWGTGPTLDEAIKNASRPAQYVAYVAKPDTAVSEIDGGLSWMKGFKPKIIQAKGAAVIAALKKHGAI